MQKSHNFSKSAIKDKTPVTSPNKATPPPINGYGINTDQFKALLSGNQLYSHETSFDKAVRISNSYSQFVTRWNDKTSSLAK